MTRMGRDGATARLGRSQIGRKTALGSAVEASNLSAL
eukprot:CAMPEP_0206437742 /NCGR_PEP_ID=MMETSP0324_2-20121206/11212_1 /ASSEMBLY_ACC=CAM_ASM_000836 /TAXON_ID=2866 /ORGANISM="Crypthecodinium cohnii, Strain Seligo" /LENGTH=36 /DNA_ID= /DNA_START= /DNA_END= /DNA_ORIENTATION=